MNLIDKYVERRLIEKRKELLRKMNIMNLRREIARLREHVGLVRPDGADAWRATSIRSTQIRDLKSRLSSQNCSTIPQARTKEYSSDSFIPIAHEKVLVFAGFKKITWAELVTRALEELGGGATNQEMYPHWQGTRRPSPSQLTRPRSGRTYRRKRLGWTLEYGRIKIVTELLRKVVIISNVPFVVVYRGRTPT